MTNRIKRVNVIWLLTTYPFVMDVAELDYDYSSENNCFIKY